MSTVSLLHQKGGTGKSTLAISAACALAGHGEPVLLIDGDPQGTSSDWGNRFGATLGVETLTHLQPTFPELVARLTGEWRHILIDAPPSLSEVTASILAASDRVIIPVRPSPPDLWALPWLAAAIGKLRRDGQKLDPLLVFNMHRDEPLEALRAEALEWDVPVWEETIPADAAFVRLFEGTPLPESLAELVARLVG